MSGGGGREPTRRLPERDVAAHPVDHACNDRAAEEQLQQPILELNIGGQREEIEADVLPEDRIALAKWHLMKEAKRHVPARDFDGGENQPQEDGTASDAGAPGNARRDLVGQFAYDLRRTRRKGGPRLRGTEAPRVTMRQEPRHPYSARRGGEHGDKQERLGGKDRPKNVDIADRRKPQPVDQDASDAPDDDQADDD